MSESKMRHTPSLFLKEFEREQAIRNVPPAKPSQDVLKLAIERLGKNAWPIIWVTKKGLPYLAHRHPVNEQLLLLAGALEFWDVEAGDYFEVLPGDELLIPAGCVHCVRRRQGATYLMGLSEPVDMDDDFVLYVFDMSDESIALMHRDVSRGYTR